MPGVPSAPISISVSFASAARTPAALAVKTAKESPVICNSRIKNERRNRQNFNVKDMPTPLKQCAEARARFLPRLRAARALARGFFSEQEGRLRPPFLFERFLQRRIGVRQSLFAAAQRSA